MKKWIVNVVFIVLSIALAASARAIFLGTCEGYVKDSFGNLVEGAFVNVTVVGCSGAGCSATTYSDANGYYVVANLNLDPGGWVRVAASKNSAYGEATGQADNFQAAFVNVTMCTAPQPPTLQPIADTHDPSFFVFNWTSYGQTDDFYFDGTTHHDVDPPQYRYNLAFKTYTWGVRTCNADCCSPWIYDTFEVYNNPPPAPTLVDQPDTGNNTVELKWFSVSDPEGDAIYYDFYIDTQPVRHNVSSPQMVYGLSYGSHVWGVRACDQFGACSAWSTDTFNVVCEPPSAPTLQAIADSHDPSFFLFNWTSGIDPNGRPTHDDFYFDGTTHHDVDPPQYRYNLAFKTYTWGVRTCNADCCSPWIYDTFEVYNNPPPAPILVDELDTHSNTVELEWSSGGADPEGDATYFNLMFDGTLYTNVTSPMTFSGLSYGSHTWKVQECDPWDCSSWSVDTFSVTNNAPSEPILEEINHTSESRIVLRWTSGIDPDGDPTYDEYQFETNAIVSPATSPQIESVSGVKIYTWRVRTCDVTGACSKWVRDDFIRYECPPCVCECPPCPPCRRRVSGGKVVYVCPPELVCNESWVCEEWGPCIGGIQERECIDINKCNTTCHKPPTIRRCKVEKPMAPPVITIGVRKIVIWPFILSAIAFAIISFVVGVLVGKEWKAKRKR